MNEPVCRKVTFVLAATFIRAGSNEFVIHTPAKAIEPNRMQTPKLPLT